MDWARIGGAIAIAIVGAIAGWWAAGVWHAWNAPAAPVMSPLPGVPTFALDAEVFVEGGDTQAVRREKLLAVARFLDEQQPHNLACAVSPELDAARGTLSEGGSVVSGAFVVLGTAYLTAVSPAGEGSLRIEGYQPAPLQWSGVSSGAVGSCAATVQLTPAAP